MDALNFIYWLQGHLEIGNPQGLNLEQVNIIKEHIALVLEKKTPSRLADYATPLKSFCTNELVVHADRLPQYPTAVFNHQGSC